VCQECRQPRLRLASFFLAGVETPAQIGDRFAQVLALDQ
jgi:hypothetical protein